MSDLMALMMTGLLGAGNEGFKNTGHYEWKLAQCKQKPTWCSAFGCICSSGAPFRAIGC